MSEISRDGWLPTLHFPEELPVSARREDIQQALQASQVVVVAGETGSGKTTQLPKICLEMGRGRHGLIGHTQPRRIAARTVASRIAEELKVSVGQQVGYQVRFNEQLSDNTLIKLMTDGVLLAEIQSDPLLRRYDTLIIDEAHERSLNIDFLLGYLKQLLPKRPDLKLLITSATIDVEKFSRHFDDAPVVEVSGRTYPVEVVYAPAQPDQELAVQILEVLQDILTLPKRGDILVFLSGEREIRETAKAIRDARLPHLTVAPLYARLSLAEQNKVFQPHKGIRVVLATNVAETSLTVPGIRYVIDPGTARISRYSYRSKVQRLPVEAISQASANQRKGRCGRVSDGVCYRLYTEEDFNKRPFYTDPEIVRTNLAAVILQMLQLRIGDIRDFPFIDPPDQRLINDGFSLLQELRAVRKGGSLSKAGRMLSAMPVDPRLGTMLLAAAEQGALREVLIIVAVLSIQDPRERPAEKQQAADEKHAQWRDKDSDFITLLNLWNHFEEQRRQLSRRQFDSDCRRQFISPLRMREWRDMHHQLHGFCKRLKLPENRRAADYGAIHRALLCGLLGHIGFRHDNKEYLGARNRHFYLFPGSGLFKKPPKWVVAAELIETSRLYAHNNARIDPEWLPRLAGHLVKKSYSEPHYDSRSGQVMAYEKQMLYGLTIVDKRRCSYGKINPAACREYFIRGALVEGGYRGKGKFFDDNQKRIKELEEVEAKVRRRDILVDEQVLYDFYAERIPFKIINLAGFEHWRKQVEQQQPKLLYIDRERLVQNAAGLNEEAQFPNSLHWQGVDYSLRYCFQPGAEDDGVTATIPLAILHQVPRYRFEWLVPGLLREKCIAMVKGLPKQMRRHFVPVPDYVDRALANMSAVDTPLAKSLAHQLKRQTGVDIAPEAWLSRPLDDYYLINFRLIDEDGNLVAQSRDLLQLKARYRQRVQSPGGQGDNVERDNLSSWDFGELPESRIIERTGLTIKTYPALVLKDTRVDMRLLDNPIAAANHTRRALVQLLINVHSQPAKYLRKNLFKGLGLQLTAAGLPEPAALLEDAINASYAEALLADQPLPRDQRAFERLLEAGKAEIVSHANNLEQIVKGWLDNLQALRRQIDRKAFPASMEDLELQLQQLFAKGFLLSTPIVWLREYQRYIKAALLRRERLPGQRAKDEEAVVFFQRAREILALLQRDWLEKTPTQQREIIQYRFMLEEYRVSLFAQQLGTRLPVSEQRLARQLAKCEVVD